MANLASVVIFYFAILAYCKAIGPFSDVLDNAVKCEDTCNESYAPHTYPNGEESNACQRGCRLYTVTKFITSDEPKEALEKEMTHAKLLCFKSCVEAYNETSPLKTACQAGCDSQEIISTNLKKTEQEVDSGKGMTLLRPVMEIHEVTSKVMGMLKVVQSSITTFFMGKHNEMIAVEGPVKITFQMNPDAFPTDGKKIPDDHADESVNPFTNDDSSIVQSSHSGSVIKVPIRETNSFSSFYEGSKDKIENYSFRLGVPPYLFMICLGLFMIGMVYVIFSFCSMGLRKKKKMENPLKVIPHHAMPVKLVRPEDLTKLSIMDEEETPALPGRIDLPHKFV